MAKFTTAGEITSANNQEVLAALTYLKDTYTTRVVTIRFQGDAPNKPMTFSIVDATYPAMVSTVTDLIQKYGDGVRLRNWAVQYDSI